MSPKSSLKQLYGCHSKPLSKVLQPRDTTAIDTILPNISSQTTLEPFLPRSLVLLGLHLWRAAWVFPEKYFNIHFPGGHLLLNCRCQVQVVVHNKGCGSPLAQTNGFLDLPVDVKLVVFDLDLLFGASHFSLELTTDLYVFHFVLVLDQSIFFGI